MTNPKCTLLLIALLLPLCTPHADGNPGGHQGAPPPIEPQLRIETGMHTAALRRIAVDAVGKWLVTGSEDKTIRVWDIATGNLARTIRVPLGGTNEGKLFSVALSPDGTTIAAGGWTSPDGLNGNIYLFDRESGTLIKRIGALPNIVIELAFSREGTRFAAGISGKNGIQVFSASSGALLWKDSDFGDACYGLDFDASGRLVASCWDGFLRLYSPTGQRVAKQSAPIGKQPFAVRFSPDGSKIAVGYSDLPRVSVVSGNDLQNLYQPDTTGITKYRISTICWSLDGESLAAGVIDGDRLRQWRQGGRGSFTDLKVAESTLMDLRALPGGRIAVGAADPRWCIVSADGKRIEKQASPSIADYRALKEKFLLAEDGASTAFGFQAMGNQPARFAPVERSLSVGMAPAGFGSVPVTKAAGLEITDWEDKYQPKLNGKPLTLRPGEICRSLAIAPDRRHFLLGSEWNLRYFNADGTQAWEIPAPGSCWAVNVNRSNGSIGVAALGDGTIRWFRMRDGKELLAFFPHTDKKRWVAWTPSGYYDCSPGGEDLIGWHLNRGADSAADFFPASRFRSRYYRPDIIAFILTALDETEAVRFANAEKGRPNPDDSKALVTALPPVVAISAPGDFSETSEGLVRVTFTVRSPTDAPVQFVRALVDGRPVGGGTRGLDFGAAKATGAGEEREMVIPIPERDCEIAILAENKNAISAPALIRIKWKKPVVADAAILKPKLYVLAVGVGSYKNSLLSKLDFPAKDARDFTAAWQAQAGGLYREADVKVLTDADATSEGVRDGLEWLEKNVTARDVAVVFLAGHGANDRNQTYHFLTHNFDPERWRSTAIPRSDIESLLKSLPGKVYLFLDTCSSGNILGGRTRGEPDITGLINELTLAEAGVAVFAASSRFQSALENPDWGNGAFTKALLEALTGKTVGPLSNDARRVLETISESGKVTLSRLDAYVAERVKQLTAGKQTPTHSRPSTIQDLPIAVRK